MDPRDFFAQTGLPQPSSFPTAAEIGADAEKLSRQVLSSWHNLQVIVERREASLRKRWLKRTLEQRKKVLQTYHLGGISGLQNTIKSSPLVAHTSLSNMLTEDLGHIVQVLQELHITLPNMPLVHRPDFEAYQKKSLAQRQAGLKHRDAYLRPYINMEDLVEGKNLLLLLNSRARNPPSVFARADFNATRVGLISGATMPAFLNEYTMLLSDATSPKKYGRLVSWDEDDRAFDWMHNGVEFMPGEGLLVLEIQQGLYSFLFRCCQTLFHDISTEELLDEKLPVLPEPEAIINRDSAYASIGVVASEAPYRPPAAVNFSRLRDIVAAQRDAAIDNFWDLREDPGYFAATVRDWADHRQETLLDKRGRRHPQLDDLVFWDRVTSSVVHSAYENVILWDLIHQKLQVVSLHQDEYRKTMASCPDLPEKFEKSLRHLKELVEKLQKMPIEALKIGVPPSPPLRSNWVRELHQPDSSKIQVRSKSSVGDDKLMFIFSALWDQQALHIFTLARLMDELDRLLQRDSGQRQRLSGWVSNYVSQLAIMGEILNQIDLHPGVAKFEQVWDGGDAEAATKASIQVITRFGGAGIRVPELGSSVIPLSKFAYPVEKRKTVQTVEILRTAEKNLDLFWAKVDRELLDKAGIPQRDHFHQLLPSRGLLRTQEWVEEPMARSVTEWREPLAELSEKFSQLGQIEEKPDWAMPDTRIKPKTRGTANRPDPKVAAAEPVADIQTIFVVGKRAFKVFSTLFYIPTKDDPVGEIPWNDFLHAMASTGFSIEKLYGSVWQFTPSDLDVENSISFHEPHPHGKIPFRTARRIGRRLHRTYGWDGTMFRQQ